MKGYITILLMSCLAIRCYGEIQWESTTIQHQAQPGDEAAVGEFRFTNVGDQPVTIRSVRTSCGCTTAELQKQVYEPGESGTIVTTFTFGDRVGAQVKHITVGTDDPEHSAYTLSLRVDIPQLLTIEPKVLVWRDDDPHEPKTIILTSADDWPVHVISVETDNADFEVALHPRVADPEGTVASKNPLQPQSETASSPTAKQDENGPPRQYVITVTPRPVDDALAEGYRPLATILIHTDYPPEKPRMFRAYARIIGPHLPRSHDHSTTQPSEADGAASGTQVPTTQSVPAVR